MRNIFKFYLKIFTTVQHGSLVSYGRCPTCKQSSQFLWIISTSVVTSASVIRDRNSSKLAGRGGTKTLSLTYPHTLKSRGVKSAVVVTTNNTACSAPVYDSMTTGRNSNGSAGVECRLAVWMKTLGLGATFKRTWPNCYFLFSSYGSRFLYN